MRRIVVSLACLASLVGCEELIPCTECPDVSGVYSAVFGPGSAISECAMQYPGETRAVKLVQNTSELTADELWMLTGVLADSLEAIFSGGKAEVRDPPMTLKVSMTGKFGGEVGTRTYNGNVKFTNNQDCTISAPATLTQTGPLPGT